MLPLTHFPTMQTFIHGGRDLIPTAPSVVSDSRLSTYSTIVQPLCKPGGTTNVVICCCKRSHLVSPVFSSLWEDDIGPLSLQLLSPHYPNNTQTRCGGLGWCKEKSTTDQAHSMLETMFEDAAQRKQAKYEELQQNTWGAVYVTNIITLEVGSRGMANDVGFAPLKDPLSMRDRDLTSLLQSLSLDTIRQSHQIWCYRNNLTWTLPTILLV